MFASTRITLNYSLLSCFFIMSTKIINGTKKRKHATEEDALPKRKDDFEGDVGLEMDSDDEGEGDENSEELSE